MATSIDFSTQVLGKINDRVLSYSLEDSEIGNRDKHNTIIQDFFLLSLSWSCHESNMQ